MYSKGISFSIIAIIAFLGILGLSIWSGYQLSVGSRYSSTYGDISKQDAASFKMETVKKDLEQGLKFSANQAAIKVAANGGTGSTTFWSCSPNPVGLPTPEEVKSALSNEALDFFNAFISNAVSGGELFEIKADIPTYSCVGTFDNGEDVCSEDDSSGCEGFWSSGTGESEIEIHEPSYMVESDEVITYVDKNRFFWIYYKLYNDYNLDSFIQNYVCQGPIPKGQVKARLISALDAVCEHYKNELFDGYVDCSYEILCFEEMNPMTCLNTPCFRDEFVETDCGAPTPTIKMSGNVVKTTSGDSNIVYLQEDVTTTICIPQVISRQYNGEDSLRFRITLTDNKYNIFTMRTEPVKLIWRINGVVDIDHSQCPIVWEETIGCSTGTAVIGPPPEPKPRT